MRAAKFNLLFFGSDRFSVRVLNNLLKRKLCPIEVVTGENSLLDKFSDQHRLIRYRWPLREKGALIKNNIGLVASFGHLINVKTIDRLEYGMFNVHPSLLPQYRGSTPIQTAILDDIRETGCTIMRIPPIAKFDIGDIVLQHKLLIEDRLYATELSNKLADMGSSLVEELLLNYDYCMKSMRPQGTEGITYTKMINSESGLIKFRTEDSRLIERKVRAYSGTVDLHTFLSYGSFSNVRVRLEDLRDPEEVALYDIDRLLVKMYLLDGNSANIPPGTLFCHKTRRQLCFKCADDRWIAFEYVTRDGRAKTSGFDFYNGYLSRYSWTDTCTDF